MNMHVSPLQAAPDPHCRRSDDRELIALCKRAERLLVADLRATLRREDTQAIVEKRCPPQPCDPGFKGLPLGSSSYLRGELKRHDRPGRSFSLRQWRSSLRRDIAIARAHERECRRIEVEAGLGRAVAVAARAGVLARNAVSEVAAVPAATLYGSACKAALVATWLNAGYGLHDEGEELVLSVVEDTRMLGTGGNIRTGGRLQ